MESLTDKRHLSHNCFWPHGRWVCQILDFAQNAATVDLGSKLPPGTVRHLGVELKEALPRFEAAETRQPRPFHGNGLLQPFKRTL
jgi:hypothetical protein